MEGSPLFDGRRRSKPVEGRRRQSKTVEGVTAGGAAALRPSSTDFDFLRPAPPVDYSPLDPSVPRRLDGWRSPALAMDMPIVSYGHAGRPLLLFPTAAADFLENERFYLVKAVEPFL